MVQLTISGFSKLPTVFVGYGHRTGPASILEMRSPAVVIWGDFSPSGHMQGADPRAGQLWH